MSAIVKESRGSAAFAFAVTTTVDQLTNATSVHLADKPFSFNVKSAVQVLVQVVVELQAATPATQQERQARDRALAGIVTAQSQIAQAHYVDAIGPLVTALGELAKVTSVNLTAPRIEIGNAIQEAARRCAGCRNIHENANE